MIEIVWECIVRQEVKGHFELAFGPGGAWSDLFAGAPGFRGTTLLRDTKNPSRYLAIDLWDAEAQRDQFVGEREAEHAALTATFAEWTESHLG